MSPCLHQFVSRMRPVAAPCVLRLPFPDVELPDRDVLVTVQRALM